MHVSDNRRIRQRLLDSKRSDGISRCVYREAKKSGSPDALAQFFLPTPWQTRTVNKMEADDGEHEVARE